MSNIRPLRSMLPATERVHFAKFAEDLQKSVRRSFVDEFVRYQKASVLAFDWSNDTMGVQHFRDDLLQLLREDYGFKTETYVLNARDPPMTIAQDFQTQLIRFRMENRPTNGAKHLLIYYYSGHSDSGPKQNQLRLGGRVHHEELLLPHLDWYRFAQLALDVPGCETLLIMDSCNSEMAGIRPDGEILTAGGRESVISAGSESGLTSMLIEEIVGQNGRPFTACDLHANLLTKALRQNINLAPIHKAPADFTHPSVLFHKIQSHEVQEPARPLRSSTARVLMTVSIRASTLPLVDDWKKWLSRNIPPDVNIIEFMAHWEESTRIILVSIPIHVWNYIKDDPGYSFVSFIMGDMNIRHPFHPESMPLEIQNSPASEREE